MLLRVLMTGVGIFLAVAGSTFPARAAEPASALIGALKAGDLTGVETLLKGGADANSTDLDGSTAVLLATMQRDTKLLSTLLAAGGNPDTTNRYGASPLHVAARNGDVGSTRLLLGAGADRSVVSVEGETVLMAAALTGNVELLSALLEGGKQGGDGASQVSPNAKESWMGQTALMLAAAEGHGDAIRLLVTKGARVDEYSTEISVPAVNPARRGGAAYSTIPKGHMVALHFAARNGRLDAVRALIEAKANLNLTDADGTNALVLAAQNGHPDVAIELLNAGADPNVADNYGRTVLFMATDMSTRDAFSRPVFPYNGKYNFRDVVALALSKGANPNVRLSSMPQIKWAIVGGDYNPVMRAGATPFLRAAMSADLELMNMLLKAGADPFAVTNDDPRPSSIGPALGMENSGRTTPLMGAAGVGWRDELSRGRSVDAIAAVNMLLELGGKINEANQGGNTPLHGAALRGDPDLVRFLLTQGGDPSLKNTRGLTPLDIAKGQPDYRIQPNEAVAAVLRDYRPESVSRTAKH